LDSTFCEFLSMSRPKIYSVRYSVEKKTCKKWTFVPYIIIHVEKNQCWESGTRSGIRRIRMFSGLQDPDPLVRTVSNVLAK
jgi:hypothetical protein